MKQYWAEVAKKKYHFLTQTKILTYLFTEKVQEVKKNFLQESGIQFSELEEKVLQFHLSNLEFACGSTLDQVWETHNFKWPLNEA